jgi:hypothetical protein
MAIKIPANARKNKIKSPATLIVPITIGNRKIIVLTNNEYFLLTERSGIDILSLMI